MSHAPRLSRRAVLRGLGVAIALPWLESLRPLAVFGGDPAPGSAPLRLAFLYVPNGVHLPDWTPKEAGPEFALPPLLEPLAPFRDRLLVLSGLAHDKANANGDGPGDHARAAATFLTARQAVKGGVRLGVSVDQVAAARVGGSTRLPSLEIGGEPGAQAGDCDSGYSCAYSSNLSWAGEASPRAKEVDPRAVFDRLFADDVGGSSHGERLRRLAAKRSILDYVRDDAERLAKDLGAADRAKVDEYLAGVRELERRVDRAAGRSLDDPADVLAGRRPAGIPADPGEHLRLLGELTALAFEGDVTRVATFMFANEGSNRAYPAIGVRSGHHEISHHGGDDRKIDGIRRINRFHVEALAHFLGRLRAAKEGDGTLLDHTMVVYGSGIGDGNRHNHDDLPILLAGGGNGTLAGGRHVRYARGTPVANLFLSLLDRMGASAPRFGDSTGRLPAL